MKKKFKFLALILSGCMALGLVGCGSSKSESAYNNFGSDYRYADYAATTEEAYADYAYDDYGYENEVYEVPAEGSMDVGMEAPDVTESAATSTRKLIRTVNMDVETKTFDDLLNMINSKLNELGGYVENSDIYNGSSYYQNTPIRNASMTLRVPSKNLDVFLDALQGQATVTNINQSVEDVTLSYVDMDSRKKSLQTEQDRLLELLSQAEDMEDILLIEERLSEVRYNIESMESQLRTYDNKVDYSTIYINIQEVETLTVVEPESTGDRISREFSMNVARIGFAFREFGIGIVVNIPYILIWAIFILVVFFIVKGIIRSRKKKKTKKMNAVLEAEKKNE